MFDKFLRFFGELSQIQNPISDRVVLKTTGFNELLNFYGGYSFGKGLYRLHRVEDIDRWNILITEGFPEYSGRIQCFGFDWLGRQFALDNQREQDGQLQILMFEPGTGQVLEIPCNFLAFHNEEIPSYHDACLASDFFSDWLSIHQTALNHDQCIGYKSMLFLGGDDDISNLETSNMEVYWSICTQLLEQTRELPEGTVINIKEN